MSRKADVPKRSPARVAGSLHPDIDGEPGRYQWLWDPKMAGDNLFIGIKDRMGECPGRLFVHHETPFIRLHGRILTVGFSAANFVSTTKPQIAQRLNESGWHASPLARADKQGV
jgi:hypothetical protein